MILRGQLIELGGDQPGLRVQLDRAPGAEVTMYGMTRDQVRALHPMLYGRVVITVAHPEQTLSAVQVATLLKLAEAMPKPENDAEADGQAELKCTLDNMLLALAP